MIKKILISSVIIFSSASMASNVDNIPDCSKKNDGSIDKAIITNLDQMNSSKYLELYLGKNPKDIKSVEVERLSSQQITDNEKKDALLKKASQLKFNKKDIQESGLDKDYTGKMYKQYYKLTSDKNLSLIVETYATSKVCAVDIGNIYIISDQINSTAPEYFIDRTQVD